MPVDKNYARENGKAKRRGMSRGEVIEKSYAISLSVLQSEVYKNAKSVMLYMPIGSEVLTSLIRADAEESGKAIFYPVTDEKTGEISAYSVTDKTEFKKGGFSIPEPQNAKLASTEEIDLIIVPGVAFSKNGDRVGYGKGCYDRFLKKTDAKRMGICYELQIFSDFSTDENDERMDYIVTENGIININDK